MGDYMYFRRLADMRNDRDLKQKEVAAYLGLHPDVYGRYEKGKREIPVWAVIKLAEYYRTSTDYLLGRTDDPAPPRA
ncbi:Helix-turn-helix [uncultured Flavonifractor sp.]|nr:transcriptional regulator [Oscillospiraceae bacterium]SCI69756.1 Helix-turn-helix [uncultured Flavonifractor sp.]